MFYRRKVILALLELSGGQIDKHCFHNLLFLYTVRKQSPEYDFVPCTYGAYSFSLRADREVMLKKGLISTSKNTYIKPDNNSYVNEIKPSDGVLLEEVASEFGKLGSAALMEYVFNHHPFYAINSSVAAEILSATGYKKVENEKGKDDRKCLFTIGYEGISPEIYLQKLIRNNVKLLVDVRKNPLSMKYGFSKKTLREFCNSLHIEYIHIPEVGIASDKRKNLKTRQEFDELFAEYRKSTLGETRKSQLEILDLLEVKKRIALTCFEADPHHCHRMYLAESIANIPGFDSPVVHL